MLGPMRRAVFAGLAVALGLALSPAAASAAVTRRYGYEYEQVWSATLRLLVVDRGFKIIEKDPETGYIVFEFKESAKDERSWRASAELIRDKDPSDRPVVKVKLSIAGKPELPHTLLHDKLAEKLRSEYGASRS